MNKELPTSGLTVEKLREAVRIMEESYEDQEENYVDYGLIKRKKMEKPIGHHRNVSDEYLTKELQKYMAAYELNYRENKRKTIQR